MRRARVVNSLSQNVVRIETRGAPGWESAGQGGDRSNGGCHDDKRARICRLDAEQHRREHAAHGKCTGESNGQPDGRDRKPLLHDERNDVALLRVEQKDLTPAKFVDAAIIPGGFIVTPDESGEPLVMGVVSTDKRSLIGVNQAYLGVRPIDSAAGVELAEITAGGSAELAGLRKGDVVTKIGLTEVSSVTDLVNAIRLLCQEVMPQFR